MSATCIDPCDLSTGLAGRDPETLIGPLLWVLTRLARGGEDAPVTGDLFGVLVAHCAALAAHPLVAPELRIAARALAIEHRFKGRHALQA